MARKFEIRNSTAEFLTFVAEGKEQGFSLAALFQTHPTIEQRVAALQQLNCP